MSETNLSLEVEKQSVSAIKEIREIYLDNNATTPLDSEVLEAMMPFLTNEFANPSSIHEAGRRVRKAVEEAMETSGAIDNIEFIDEPVAAAIGAGLPVDEPVGNMIVDIGGGTTEVAVLSLQGIVISDSVRVAGDAITDAIKRYLKRSYNLVVGERTSEQIKIQIGSAYPTEGDQKIMEIRGLNIVSGLPKTITITVEEIRECIADTVELIVDAIKKILEQTPPELAGDIIDRGIMLAGGGALLKGLDSLIANETGIITHIASNPLKCVVYGTGKVLEDYERLGRSSWKK